VSIEKHDRCAYLEFRRVLEPPTLSGECDPAAYPKKVQGHIPVAAGIIPCITYNAIYAADILSARISIYTKQSKNRRSCESCQTRSIDSAFDELLTGGNPEDSSRTVWNPSCRNLEFGRVLEPLTLSGERDPAAYPKKVQGHIPVAAGTRPCITYNALYAADILSARISIYRYILKDRLYFRRKEANFYFLNR
jgi:hypothetical protein